MKELLQFIKDRISELENATYGIDEAISDSAEMGDIESVQTLVNAWAHDSAVIESMKSILVYADSLGAQE